MIAVKRVVKPDILLKHEATWTKAIRTAPNATAKEAAINKYKHPQIKQTLETMFHGKCAYCESYILNVDYGDIEHFKPKSKFSHLAVKWDNLLLSCKKCNDKAQKGEHWPTKAFGGPLVNPCKERPTTFFEFVFDEITRIALVKPLNIRGETAERIYGLNKHTLLKDRNNAVRKLVALAQYYHTDNEAKEILDTAVKDESEYAAFARMVKAKYTY
jgi:uncharacterized protein (TIGR02646 family)